VKPGAAHARPMQAARITRVAATRALQAPARADHHGLEASAKY